MTLDSVHRGASHQSAGRDPAAPALAPLEDRYREVRRATLQLREPLSEEDCAAQSMPDASPVKWHLAHTTWFFETFVLAACKSGYQSFDPAYALLFNSYYNSVGEQFSRPKRGMLTRPSLAEVTAYRASVDAQMDELFAEGISAEFEALVELGIHHEQQHQELLLTDLKHLLSLNPIHPVYLATPETPPLEASPLGWKSYPSALRWIGYPGEGFHFDNEGPRHRQFVDAFSIATRPITNGEFLEFMADGGYSRPELWLSEGWACVQQRGWHAPLYWEPSTAGRAGWRVMTLSGLRDLERSEPLCHVSYYEADAFASWSGGRLPSEAEWEVVASEFEPAGPGGARSYDGRGAENFVEQGRLHPQPDPGDGSQPSQLFGDVWEWTRSPYTPYSGYRAAEGAIGEYNGKFMCSQMVLRGGSCASPRSHLRASYRNFFYPDARWQFSGVRLARDVLPAERESLS